MSVSLMQHPRRVGIPPRPCRANSSPLNHGLSLPSCAWQMSQPHPGPYFYKASRVCACAQSRHVPSKPITRQFPAILTAPVRSVSPLVPTSSGSEGPGTVWLLVDKLCPMGPFAEGGHRVPVLGILVTTMMGTPEILHTAATLAWTNAVSRCFHQRGAVPTWVGADSPRGTDHPGTG